MYAFDEDSCNTIVAEEIKQKKEERELKNQLLKITNTDRKQKEWSKHFHQEEIETNLVF